MARRKKSSGFEVIAIGIAGVVALITAIPKELWIVLGLAGAAGLVLYVLNKSKKSPPEDTDAAAEWFAPVTNERPRRYAQDDMPINVLQSGARSTEYGIPAAPKTFGNARWIPPGESVEVAGVTLPGGMFYVGTTLTTPMGYNDPCLIDPSKPVAARGDYTEREMGYWPSYSDIPKTARRAYLNWLAGGRLDPEADIGYVFIYFYGLERRAIIDAANDPVAQRDWPLIAAEIRRLLGIYGDMSQSFRRYASELLDWVSIADHPSKLYEKPVPSFPKTFEVPLYVRLALGQAAVDGAPVPAHVALAWTRLNPNVALRTPAKRCVEEFDRLFEQRYTETVGAGLVLPRNRTKLKLSYQPASAGFHGYKNIQLTFGETPDVTVLTAPLKKLQKIAEDTTQELDAYSRYVGKNPDSKFSLEGLLYLPAALWPASMRSTIEGLRKQVAGETLVMPFQMLVSQLGGAVALTKDRGIALVKALASQQIGFVPDVLYGAKLPKPDDAIALFALAGPDSGSSPAYQAGVLTLQLASAVANADGDLGDSEFGHLKREVGTWTHLSVQHTQRLLAHLYLLRKAPVTLAALKKKLEPLDMASKEAIGAFMATVAQSDGMVSPAEVKMLEKVYKVLGIDAKKVFSDIHAVAAGGTAVAPGEAGKIEETGFRLDRERISALQKDTEHVTKLLSRIFKEEELPEAAPVTEPEPEELQPAAGILGMDEAHTAFARMLLSRPTWGRDELQDVAADLNLMLDGALERVNEAAFDAHDIPFTEGEDPVEINAEILDKVAA